MRIIRLILACAIITLAVFTDIYGSPQITLPASYRDVPGVTESEIKAVESFRAREASFTYGVTESSEAFYGSGGGVSGFSALFCGWLSDLFGIPFAPVIRSDIPAALEGGEIDFAGTTDKNNKTYTMTGAIVERPVKIFRIAGSEPFRGIADARPVRLAFVAGSTEAAEIISGFEYACQAVMIPSADAAYEALKTGKADAFFCDGSAEPLFQSYSDTEISDYLPMVLSTVYLTAKNPVYAPIISIVQKTLISGGERYLVGLYNDGFKEYQKHRLYSELMGGERAYIQTHSVIPIVAQYYNYPISFYNAADKQWQGIVFDLLAEVGDLTGMSFQVVNAPDAEFADLNKKLVSGEASLITRLVRTKDREGLFLWSETSVMDDKYVLISRADFHDISLNEILNVKVGLVTDTAQANLFRSWFPNNVKTVEYSSLDNAVAALDRGEMDLVMASYSQLLFLTNYRGLAGYKANFVFDSALEANLGFNIGEADLRSVIDKALGLIDTKEISERWSYKVFTPQAQPSDLPVSTLVGGAVLALFIIIAIIVYLIKRRRDAPKKPKPPLDGNGKKSFLNNFFTKKMYNFLFLFPVVIMITFSLFFARLTREIEQNLLNEKFEEKKLEVSMMANNADEFIGKNKDWEIRHDYYQQSLIFNMEELDRSYMTFAVVYDKDLKRLSKQVNYNGGFDPMEYTDFVTAVYNNQTLGDMVIKFKPADEAEREVYVHYRWIPTGSSFNDRFLVVIGISKLTIVTQTDGWFRVGSIALILITTVLNIAMVAVICRMASKK